MSELTSQLDGAATSGQDPVPVNEDAAVVVGPVDIQSYGRFTVYVYNAGGKGVDDVTVETAPETGNDAYWTSLQANIGGVPLGSGGAFWASFVDKSVKYIRVKASCAVGENTTAKFWISAGGHP